MIKKFCIVATMVTSMFVGTAIADVKMPVTETVTVSARSYELWNREPQYHKNHTINYKSKYGRP